MSWLMNLLFGGKQQELEKALKEQRDAATRLSLASEENIHSAQDYCKRSCALDRVVNGVVNDLRQ